MTPKINFRNLVCALLPWYKRQIVRLSFLRVFVAPLQQLFNEFDFWRSNTRMIINVTSQVAVFEGYLRTKYGQPIAIKIVTFDDGALEVCLEGEQYAAVPLVADLEIEPETPKVSIPLYGEIRERFGDADFIVYIPAEVDIDMLQADIERFKQALTRYKIVQA